MASYKRRRDDDATFGFGRYPKRSKRDHIDNNRSYHSMSLNRRGSNSQGSRLNGINTCDKNLYHFSLSSELFGRQSDSNGQRFSTCSNGGISNNHYNKHSRGVNNRHLEENDPKKSKLSKDEMVAAKQSSRIHSRVGYNCDCMWC